MLRAAHALHLPIVRGVPTANGVLELQACVREQCLSHAYHRYGHCGLGSPFAVPTGV